MKKASYLLVLIVLMFSAIQVHATTGNYYLSNSKSYTFSQKYVIKNFGKNEIKNSSVEIFTGTLNDFPYQKDADISFSKEPDAYKTDTFGNRIAIFNINRLSPGDNIEIDMTRKLTSSDIRFKLNPDNTSNTLFSNTSLEKYLVSSDKIESDNKKIITKAKELTNGLSGTYSKAKSIFGFVNYYIDYDESDEYRNKGALSALNTGRGVCEEYATLFAALCRASGIPARVVTGYRFNDGSINLSDEKWHNMENYGHAWAEFYLENYGWVPVEATQLYTVNGVKKVYWDGFGSLEGSQYVATGFYNPSAKDMSIRYYYDIGTTPEIDFENSNVMIKLDKTDENANETDIKKESVPEFTDLPTQNWAYSYIEEAYNDGIIKGYQDNTFKPNNNVSRIEFIAMLSRMLHSLEYDSGSEAPFLFSDYPANHWSKNDYDYLANCFESVEPSYGLAGQATLVRVFGNSLNPDKPITREEAVALFDKFLDEPDESTNNFSDINDSRFKSSIIKAYNDNLINGYSKNLFKPTNNITRAEAAKLFETFLSVCGTNYHIPNYAA